MMGDVSRDLIPKNTRFQTIIIIIPSHPDASPTFTPIAPPHPFTPPPPNWRPPCSPSPPFPAGDGNGSERGVP